MNLHTRFDYSGTARHFTARHPLINSLLTHVVFWIVAFSALSVIIFLARHSMIQAFAIPVNLQAGPYLLNSALTGLLYGIAMSFLDYFFDHWVGHTRSLLFTLLVKMLIALLLLYVVFLFREYVLYDLFVAPSLSGSEAMNSHAIWESLFEIMLVYVGLMSLVFNFMRQVNKKFGPGVLLPLLLGKYRNPREEERIFMFMDLKSSTTIAESIGHLKYSGFIRDAFLDINKVLSNYDAEIYQYVGDEIVVTWKVNEGLRNHACVHFFFACDRQFQKRSDYYLKTYGQLPKFKASLHIGVVTAVEIGDIKRDIAYHGDTLNTASRIQSMCNEYGKELLVSDVFFQTSSLQDQFPVQHLGNVVLKGKTLPVGIISIEKQIG